MTRLSAPHLNCPRLRRAWDSHCDTLYVGARLGRATYAVEEQGSLSRELADPPAQDPGCPTP